MNLVNLIIISRAVSFFLFFFSYLLVEKDYCTDKFITRFVS